MNKKFKYTSLVAAGAVTLGLVGGTLAWFTSQDSVTNHFATGTVTDPDGDGPDSGIEVLEQFKEPTNLLPGTEVNKDVQVESTASYNQFIRVKQLEVVFSDGAPLEWKGQHDQNIKLKYTSHFNNDIQEGNWVDGGDGYYYYIDKVGAGSHTNTLLDSVTLTKYAGNEYKNVSFDIEVYAESVQASNDAVVDEWFSDVTDESSTILKQLKQKFIDLQSNGVNADGGLKDAREPYDSEDENGNHIHQPATQETPEE